MATAVTQHRLNALHVFCRLRDWGMPAGVAKGMARLYERGISRWLYCLGGKEEEGGEHKQET